MKQSITKNLSAGHGWFEALFSPNDEFLLFFDTGAAIDWTEREAIVFVTDARTGEHIKSFKLDEQDSVIRSAAWSPDGSKIAGVTIFGTLAIWDFQTGDLLQKTKCGNWITQVVWSHDGTRIAIVCALLDGTEWSTWGEVRDAATGETILTLSEPDDPTALFWSVAWSPDGGRLLTTGGSDEVGSPYNPVIIWDANSGRKSEAAEPP